MPAREVAEREARPRPRILVVDDEPVNRKLLSAIITDEGYTPVLADGGAKALELLARESFDLVLLDMSMPVVDGMGVLGALRARGALPAQMVVVVTANSDQDTRIAALGAGAVDFLSKPIDRLELACKMGTLVELHQLREAGRREAARSATAAVHERIRHVVEHLPLFLYEGLLAANGSIDVSWVTSNVAELTGVAVADFCRGDARYTYVDHDARDGIARVLADVAAGSATSWMLRYRWNHPRAGVRWFVDVGYVDLERRVVSGATFDITAQQKAEESLQQTQKMAAIGQLAGGIAHDFNNLLAVILSFATLVEDDLDADDRHHADILEVIKAANRAVGLTRQLLVFSRKQPSAKRPTDLDESLAQLSKLLARTVGENIDLSLVRSARPAVVRIDPVRFDQIVLNLVVNARDAMPDGGQLTIAIEPPSDPGMPSGEPARVRVTVTDTGVGIDEQTRSHIFEPFFTTKPKGTGLGLATCWSIVQEVGGSIRVDSAPGAGTTVSVELPFCDEPASEAPATPGARGVGRGEHVLVVEDEPALRRVASYVLDQAGYHVHVASDGIEAIKLVDQLHGELRAVVTDVVMPGRNGYDVADHVARVAPGTAVILTSGYIDDVERASQRSELPVLWKPVPPRDLVAAVAHAVASYQAPAQQLANTVLLVEDEPAVRAAFSRVLAAGGYVVEPAATLAAARALIAARPDFRWLLCDLTLPDGSTVGLLERLRDERPDLVARVLVMTGGASDDASERVQRAGFRMIEKPIAPKQLLQLLQTAPPPVPPALAPKPKRAPTSPILPSPVRGHGARVLLVEDDRALASATARILGDAGLDIVTAHSREEAIRALAGDEFATLVTDMGLPDGSGLDVVRELRGLNAEIPVVLITGTPSIESAAQAIHHRVSEYLTKPFAADELVRVVNAAVDAGRVARLRAQLLATRFGGDEFVGDVHATEHKLDLALPKIRMAFQPIVRAADGSVFGFEALLRCDDPALSSPPRLLTAAEVLGRVLDVGRVVRAAVARTMLDHADRVEAIFVNLHPSELHADLLADVADPLLPLARRVVLEVTERASLDADPNLDAELARIRGLGYRLAVDDLGEGYAGLTSLVMLRPDLVKIDMSLVRGVHAAPLKQDIIGALVDMARRNGITVVAEGVETLDECTTLVRLGCELLQGYLIAKPGAPFPTASTPWLAR